MGCRRVCLAGVVVAAMAAGHAHADAITVPANQLSRDLDALLALQGRAAGAAAVATPAETLTTPGPDGTVDLHFEFALQDGGYRFSFGFFDVAAVNADPKQDRGAFAAQALSAAVEVFDERTDRAGATALHVVPTVVALGFYLIPNDPLDRVLADPDAFLASGRPQPLFSIADANPGGFDQLLWFVAGTVNVLAFEDITRTGRSDTDFNDLAVVVEAVPGTAAQGPQLTAIIDPTISVAAFAAALLMIALLLRWRARRNRR